jgi:hypothetical protein
MANMKTSRAMEVAIALQAKSARTCAHKRSWILEHRDKFQLKLLGDRRHEGQDPDENNKSNTCLSAGSISKSSIVCDAD